MPQKPNNNDPRKPKIIRINLSWLYILLLIAAVIWAISSRLI